MGTGFTRIGRVRTGGTVSKGREPLLAMNERDETNLSAEESISDEVSERVRSVIAAAESAATAIRHEVEQQAEIRKRAAEVEGQRYLERAKAEAEALVEERTKRISELSDAIIEGAEGILMQIQGAEEVKQQLETMVHGLAAAAERLARESEVAPEPSRPRAVSGDKPAATVRAVPDPEPAVAEELADDDDDVEVVDAVEVVDDEPEPEHPRRLSPVERLREAAAGTGPENGSPEATEPRPARQASGFEGDEILAARLVALQMAVAGSARVEVEAHLRTTFEIEDPTAILNDVFGQESKL
jgi:hypothetical protein